jgi:hypothetical protein
LKRLASGANPAELQLGHDVSVEASAALLRISTRAGTRCRKDGQRNADQSRFVRRRSRCRLLPRRRAHVQPPGPYGRLSYHGTQHLATLGALTDYDRNKDEAEKRLGMGALAGNL